MPIMLTKETKRVRIVARSVHEGRSRCLTVYGEDLEAIVARIMSALSDAAAPQIVPGKRKAI